MENNVTISTACRILNVSPNTLKDWEKKGYIASHRTAGGHRRYSTTDVERLNENKPNLRQGKGLYDIQGKKYGSLEVIQRAPNRGTDRISWWQCKCICGRIADYRGRELVHGQRLSCGCRKHHRRKTGKHACNFKGYERIGGKYWGHLRTGAKRRNIPFDITIQDAWEIYTAQGGKCALSGLPIELNPTWY